MSPTPPADENPRRVQLAQNLSRIGWDVRFTAAVNAGEPVKRHVVLIPHAASEREALKAAFLQVFGGLHRPVRHISGVEISRRVAA